jgi:hypothetical protein
MAVRSTRPAVRVGEGVGDFYLIATPLSDGFSTKPSSTEKGRLGINLTSVRPRQAAKPVVAGTPRCYVAARMPTRGLRRSMRTAHASIQTEHERSRGRWPSRPAIDNPVRAW